ncbi:hypothetical protein HDU77_003834 [Chytriomyces hyalinus]|nr:hypothetical protein HDU77_003834 [Chytriomyces hyalinus]
MDGLHGICKHRVNNSSMCPFELDVQLQRHAWVTPPVHSLSSRPPLQRCNSVPQTNINHANWIQGPQQPVDIRRKSWSPGLTAVAETASRPNCSQQSSQKVRLDDSQPSLPVAKDSYSAPAGILASPVPGKLLTDGYVQWLMGGNESSDTSEISDAVDLSNLEYTSAHNKLGVLSSKTPSLHSVSATPSECEFDTTSEIYSAPATPSIQPISNLQSAPKPPSITATLSTSRTEADDDDDETPLALSKHAPAFWSMHRAFPGTDIPSHKYFASAHTSTWLGTTSDALKIQRIIPIDYPAAYVKGDEHVRLRKGREKDLAEAAPDESEGDLAAGQNLHSKLDLSLLKLTRWNAWIVVHKFFDLLGPTQQPQPKTQYPTMRKSVTFDETVAVAYTYDGSVYDRSSTCVTLLSPIDVAELISMRIEMNDALRRLTRMNHLMKATPPQSTRSILTAKLNLLSMANAGKANQSPQALSLSVAEHRAAETWKGNRGENLSINKIGGHSAVSMSRLAVIGSPTRSSSLAGVGGIKRGSLDSPSNESVPGGGSLATPALCSAPSSPSADSVSSISSAFYDGGKLTEDIARCQPRQDRSSFKDASLVPDWILMLNGGQDYDHSAPQSSWFKEDAGLMKTSDTGTKSRQQDFGPIGPLRPRNCVMGDTLNDTAKGTEYSQFGSSPGYLNNFYQCQGWMA